METLGVQDGHIANAPETSALRQLASLQSRMFEHSVRGDPAETLRGIAEVVRSHVEPIAVFYFGRDDDGNWSPPQTLGTTAANIDLAKLAKQSQAGCAQACQSGQVHVQHQAVPARVFVGAPVAIRGQDPEALGAVFPGESPIAQLILLMQLAGTHLALGHLLGELGRAQADYRETAALLELVGLIESSPNLDHACHVLVNEMAALIGGGQVAVGLQRPGQGCRTKAISGLAQIDGRSESTRAIEAAMDEALIRDDLTVWPLDDESVNHAALAHKNLCTSRRAARTLTAPLRQTDGRSLGALTFVCEHRDATQRDPWLLRAAAQAMGNSLELRRAADGGLIARACRAIKGAMAKWKWRIAAVVMAAALGSMAIPVPYRVDCGCQVEPTSRRFVAAPFEGTLERSAVKPGDVVSAGDLLATMDGREIRWERAGVAADFDQAKKKRDAALATGDGTEAQIRTLEMSRLELKLRLLDHRSTNLEIRSPISGIVTSGDLERAAGAPLTIGQTLFEIAPLETMIVEVEIEDAEVSHVAKGQSVEVRLDAHPGHDWPAVIDRVEPRSEIRGHNNVFIAEAALDNGQGQLRPGMRGRAKVVTPHRPLGWVLFHKPWNYATRWLP